LVTGLYRGIWRYASLPDLFNIARAATLTELIFLPVMFAFTRLEQLPRSTLLIDWLVLIALLGGPRLGYRLFKDRGLDHILERGSAQSVPVLLISTKDGADTFVRETVRDRNAVYRVIGMLSDTRSRVGRQIYGVPILGTIDDLETVVADLDRRARRPQKLILAAQNLGGAEIRRLLDRADALAIPLARLPRLTEFRQDLGDPARLVEANPVEGVLTNVVGTRNVAEAARAHGVGLVVMISTDKAVNPASVMGASKRLAESFCQALDLAEARRPIQAGGTRFVTVRFGNVLGSTGSVVPLFTRQLAVGGPLTVTHPDVTRV